MKKEFVRNPYNYDSDELSDATGLHCKDESLTEQEHLAETDINYIADRFMRTGEMPQVLKMPTHGDFEGIFDFQTAMNTIKLAKDQFMALPAKVRSRFSNDPAELIAFIEDDSNYDEALKLGLVAKRDTIEPPTTTEETHGPDRTRSTTTPKKADTRPPRAEGNATKNEGAEKP